MRMMQRKVVLDDAEVVAVIRDVRRQQQRVAASDDALLALIGRVPVDFQLQLVGLDDLGRRGEPFAELREEGDVAVRVCPVVRRGRCRELLDATRDRAIDEVEATRVVPRLRARRPRNTSRKRITSTRRGAPRGIDA